MLKSTEEKPNLRRYFAAIVALLLFVNPAFACDLLNPASITSIKDTKLLKFKLPISHKLLSNQSLNSPHIATIKNFVTSYDINLDPFLLLTNQRNLYISRFGPDSVVAFDKIIQKKIGVISDIRCLEANLLHHHLSLMDTPNDLTEFQAFILIKDNHMRIFMLSGKEDSTPDFRFIEPKLKKAQLAGYEMFGHLHNHFFYPENPTEDIGGTLIPSGTISEHGDLKFYKELMDKYSLKQAWITNGFSTAVYKASELEKLRTTN